MKLATTLLITSALALSTASFAGDRCNNSTARINGYNVVLTSMCRVKANNIDCGIYNGLAFANQIRSVTIKNKVCTILVNKGNIK